MRYKINAYKYTNSMNKGFLPYLEDIISYYFNEKIKIIGQITISIRHQYKYQKFYII